MSIAADKRHDASAKRPKAQKLRLVVASDYPLTRYAILAALANKPSISSWREAATGPELLTILDTVPTDLLILDVSLRNGLGIRLIQQCKEQHHDLRILVLSRYEEWLYAGRALRAGAMGYLNSSATPDMIVDAVQHLISGRNYLAPEVLTLLLGQADNSNGAIKDPVSQLTERELQIFELIGGGATSRSIARLLKLSPHTVETYRERLKTKLNTKNGADLVFQAIVWSLLHAS